MELSVLAFLFRLLSLGFFSKGIISIGLLSLGCFSAGILTLGLFSAGNLALGVIALGNLAIGLLTFGNLVVGGFSLGNIAIGYLAIGNKALGTYTSILPAHSDLSEISQALTDMQPHVPEAIRQILINPFLSIANSSLFPYATLSFALFLIFLLSLVCFWGLQKIRRNTINH